MVEKIRMSPIASATVDAKLKFLLEAHDAQLDIESVEIRTVSERNDLKIENVEDSPYS